MRKVMEGDNKEDFDIDGRITLIMILVHCVEDQSLSSTST
jgi:hypothetical protein